MPTAYLSVTPAGPTIPSYMEKYVDVNNEYPVYDQEPPVPKVLI